ncbi:MAG: pectinesterase family protein [Paenibacillaceae bacterium]
MEQQWSIAKDGTADFNTIQEAIDAVKPDLEQPTLLRIRNGIYHERIIIPKNKSIHLIGDHREQTVITYSDYARQIDNEDPLRYTEPYSSYIDYLRQYIEGARYKGAEPILITPLQRRTFDIDGSFQDTHGEYPAAMRQLAKQYNVPIIDLSRLSKEWFISLGPEQAKKVFMWLNPGKYDFYPEGEEDNTHLSEYGANEIAKIIAASIKELDVPLARYVLTF